MAGSDAIARTPSYVRQCGEAQCPVRPVRAGSGRRALAETYQAVTGHVAHTRNLRMRTAEGSRKDIEISLPAGTDYREGDHLGYFRSIR